MKKSEKKLKYPLDRRAEFWYTTLTMKKEALILSSQNAPYSPSLRTLSLEPTVYIDRHDIKVLCRRYYADLIEYRPCIVRFEQTMGPESAWKFRQVLDDFVELNVKSPVLDYNPLLCSICYRHMDGLLIRKYSISECVKEVR